MLRIVAICVFAFAVTVARDTCTNNQYKRYGEDCSCSDYCLDNSHCLRNGTGPYLCQCLPGLTYDPVKKQCSLDCDNPTCANKPCQHVCTTTEDSYQCSCREGFVVSPTDPTKCIDVDECQDKDKNTCQQVCTNTDGGFECSCEAGFAINAIDPTKCNEPTCTDKLAADIYFLTDSSNSIAAPGWLRALTFIVNITQAFHLGPHDVQVAFGIFSTNFVHIFNLNTYTDQATLANVVLNTTQLKSNTFTYDALNSINREGYLTSSDKGAGRKVPKILIVITDGQSNDVTKTITAATDLRKEKITILSVGVGVTNPVELQGIAGDPKNVFSVRTFGLLDTVRGEITQRVCDLPQPPAVRPCPTNMMLDLAFVIDSSNKFGAINFQRSLVFVSSIIRAFIAGQNGAQFALLLSDTDPVTVFSLTSSMDVIYQSLVNVPFTNSSTVTYNGLLAASHLLTTANGGRDDAEKTIILIIDGHSHDSSDIIKEAEELKNKGFKVVTVGILPEVDLGELANIASSPDYSFTVRSYNALLNFAGVVSAALCEEPITPEPTPPAPTVHARVNECLGNPCEHICTDTEDGFVCSCREGYQVRSVDPRKCEDRDECRLDKPCQHVCNNTEGGYQCSCREGYVLSSSDRTKCNDVNECTKKPCQHICTNSEGSFKCSCNPGSAINQIDPTKCQDPTCVNHLAADIYFLGDSSNSIAAIGWGRELTFIVNISQAFRLGPNDVQIAFGIFSTNFRHIFNLNAFTNQAALASAVLSTVQLKSNTFTYDALNAINDHDFLTSPANGGERNVPKVIIVVTDGQSQNITKTIAAADNLRKKNITILSVGVGVTNPVELQGIAGNSKNVFSVNTFGLLETVRGEITQRICDVPELPEVQSCADPGVLDLVFVIESLNRFGSINFQRNLVLISSIIRSFSIGQNNVKVALVLSDTQPIIMFNLTSSVDVIYQSIINDPKKNVSEITYKGLLTASQFFNSDHGAREGATKTIVLLSDGKSRDPSNLIDQAEEVKDKGINVVTVGILPEADIEELSAIASKPANSIQAKSYTTLLSFANQVAQAACHAS